MLRKFGMFLAAFWRFFARGTKRFWKWYKTLYVGRRWWVKCISAFCSCVVAFVIFALMVSVNFLWLFGKSPSLDSIMHPKTNNVSLVYSADGELLCKFFDENRSPVKYEEITPTFYKALIDTEDERFYSHHGVDIPGVFAAGKDYLIGKRGRGASTITQQLVKNMFKVRTQYSTGLLGKIPGLSMLIMKTKEWILATEVEMFYEKKEILTMYCNTVDFGNNSYGIKTAARTYYNTTPDSLTIDQCATLVGLLKATSRYNPKSHPKLSMERRNVVMKNMVDHGDLSQADYDRIKDFPTPLNMVRENPDDGRALYFRNAINEEMREWREANDVNFFTDGLKIYTTIDSRYQQYAEEAVLEKMYEVQQNFNRVWGKDPCWVDEQDEPIAGFVENVAKNTDYYRALESKFPDKPDSVTYYMNKPRPMKVFEYKRDGDKVVPNYKEVTMSAIDSVAHMLHYMHCGLVAMDPRNGFVKAWVGDIDYATWKYDKVKSMRQPGSTFKLFVYSAAFEKGMSPSSTELDDYLHMQVYNERKQQMEDYSPKNASGTFTGRQMSFREAFARSINVVAVRVGQIAGFDNVRSTAEAMGIVSPLLPEEAQHAKPSLCLGSMDVNLMELTNAFGTIANYGVHERPVLVTRITRTGENGEEEEIYNYKNYIEETYAVKARTAYLMQQMLKAGVNDAGGTSQGLTDYIDSYMSTTDFGGKTGTSNNHSDAWFVGVTPNLVTGVWVGGEYRCIHFQSKMGQGGRTALPVCGVFFRKLWRDKELQRQLTARYVPLRMDASMLDYDPVYDDSDQANDSTLMADTLSLETGVVEDEVTASPEASSPAQSIPDPSTVF